MHHIALLSVIEEKELLLQKPHIRGWPNQKTKEPTLLAFPGFKAGMSRIVVRIDSPNSHLTQTDREEAVSVVETPTAILFGLRTYRITPYGLKILAEAHSKTDDEYFEKHHKAGYSQERYEEQLKMVEETIDHAVQIRAVIYTQPHLTGIKSRKPYILEIKVGCNTIKEGFEWIKSKMKQGINIDDFTKAGEYLDVIGITKGKGYNGPVKRHGVTLLQKKSKHTKRGVGSIAPWTPARVQWVIARYGQLGYFRRTEYNKRVIGVGEKEETVNPLGGFIKIWSS